MLRALRLRIAGRPGGADRARNRSASPAALELPPALTEDELLAEARALAGKNRLFRSYLGMGYSRLHHAAGHPAQHPREPRLVHRLHALPGGDLPGPPGGAAELPDHGHGSDRLRRGRRLAAGRGHRRRRGDADAGRRARGRDRPPVLRLARMPPPDHRRDPPARRAPGHRGGGRRSRQLHLRQVGVRRAGAVPRHRRHRARLPRACAAGRAPPACAWPWPAICWR